MSKQTENETQTPQEFREFLLAELEASRQVIAELSTEQLEEIVGGRGYRVGTHIEIPTSLEGSMDLSGPSVTSPSSPSSSSSSSSSSLYRSAIASSPSLYHSYHSFSSSGSSGSSSSHVEYLPDVNTDAARIARVNQWLHPVLNRSNSAHF